MSYLPNIGEIPEERGLAVDPELEKMYQESRMFSRRTQDHEPDESRKSNLSRDLELDRLRRERGITIELDKLLEESDLTRDLELEKLRREKGVIPTAKQTYGASCPFYQGN